MKQRYRKPPTHSALHSSIGRVTSMDVARLAGVSQSAVSRVFTKGASASQKTAEKVKYAADALGYRPNRLARSLPTGRSRIVGLVIAYFDNYFYPEVLEKLSNALQQQGYHVLIFMAAQTADNIDHVIEEILEYQVDAIVSASVALSSPLADRCQSAGIPVVQFNRVQERSGFSSVTTDNFAGGKAVAQHLVAEDYHSFGYIAGWEGASTQRDREAGYRNGLAEAGFEMCCRAVGNFRSEQARQAVFQILEARHRPDALFVANDAMALIVLDVLRHECGLRVPEDIAVVGYDNIPPASWPSYSLTSFSQPADAMVKATVDVLIKHIENDYVLRDKRVIEGALVIRGSSRRRKDS